MNPRLVEPGFVVAYYTPTAPLVPRRTRTATTRRSTKDDIGRISLLEDGLGAQR
jgi:hypothetical protein